MDGKVLNLETKKMAVSKEAAELGNTWICDSPKSNKNVGVNAGSPQITMITSQGDSSNGTSVIPCEEGSNVFLADACQNILNVVNWEKNEQREEQAIPGELLNEEMQVEFIGHPLLVPRPPSDSCAFSCCPFPSLTFNMMALDALKVTNSYFSTPVSSQQIRKKHLTPVMEMDLESSSHETQKTEQTAEEDETKENKGKRDQFPDLFQYELPMSEDPHLYTPLYQSCFEAECLEIANQLQCSASDTRSPNAHGQNQTPKRKQGIVDVSTIENEILPYESTPFKSRSASEDALVLQPADRDHSDAKHTFFGNSILDLEKMNLELDVREPVCQVWERKLSEEPLPPTQVLKTLEELPSIDGIGVLGNTQDSANSNSRGQEKESLEIVTGPALKCTVDVQEPLERSVSAISKAHGSVNVTLNLSQKPQPEEQTGKPELNQTQLMYPLHYCSLSQCANLTVAYEMRTERLPEINTTHQLSTVLCHVITPGSNSSEGGFQEKTQGDSSSKESNGGFLPDVEQPHNTESTHNESLSLGSLTFGMTTLMTSTPLQGDVQFCFMKSIYGDSMQKDPNLSVSSVTEERCLDTMGNQKASCRKVAGTQESVPVNRKVTVQEPDRKPKLDSLPKTSSLPLRSQSSRRSLIPKTEIPARSMLPTSRRCLTLTVASEQQSSPKDFPLKGRGTSDMKPLARQSLGNIRPAFQRQSAASNRCSLAGVPPTGILCQIKEASLAKTSKAAHPNTKPPVPQLTSRFSKLPGHVSSQLSFGGRLSLGSAPRYKKTENVSVLTSVAGSKISGLEETRPATSQASSAAVCCAKRSSISSIKSSLGRRPAATGRNVTSIRDQTFRPHAAKKTHDSEQTPGPLAAETHKEQITETRESLTLPLVTDIEGDMARSQPILATSKEGKGKSQVSAGHQPCKECLQKESAKTELLHQLETVKKKLADREMLCRMHMERLQTLETTCESLKMKIHSMETSDDPESER
ncbi:uncharacterized protein LOC115474895 isoform X2 [Microcaecilia unicolor]|uniref:Uncharacterized protein LOC115474895 isoform X2 n=1 Tax=Microcaecilia unicolor TaxID=1415580 RepID=A0A6P7YN24_9AMPH|nr:uncharacterized protein LOC115474895 isoform X2 [Microcaecilia unicolor]